MRLRAVMAAGALAATVSLAPACVQAAELMNGSFEDILTGWVADPFQLAIAPEIYHHDQNDVADKLFRPVDGYTFGVLAAYQPDDAGALDPPVPPKLISQTFTTDGGWLSGWAAFLDEDGLYNDFAFVRVYNDDDNFTLFRSDAFSVAPLGYTPWTRFYRRLGVGRYTIEAGIGNATDNFETSYLLLDHFAVTATIPEPTSWAMMILGFFGLGAALRRRQSGLVCAKA